jgi:hypothetical protein
MVGGGEADLFHVSINAYCSKPSYPFDHLPIILNAGLPCDAGPFGAAPAEEALPALAFDAVELAPATLWAADVLDFSDMLSMHES